MQPNHTLHYATSFDLPVLAQLDKVAYGRNLPNDDALISASLRSLVCISNPSGIQGYIHVLSLNPDTFNKLKSNTISESDILPRDLEDDSSYKYIHSIICNDPALTKTLVTDGFKMACGSNKRMQLLATVVSECGDKVIRKYGMLPTTEQFPTTYYNPCYILQSLLPSRCVNLR